MVQDLQRSAPAHGANLEILQPWVQTGRLRLRNDKRLPRKYSISLLQRRRRPNHFGGIFPALRIAIGTQRPSSR